MKIHPEKCQYRRRTTHMYVGRFAQDDDILDKIPINILSPGNYSAHNHHPCGTGRANKIMIITIITIVKGTQ